MNYYTKRILESNDIMLDTINNFITSTCDSSKSSAIKFESSKFYHSKELLTLIKDAHNTKYVRKILRLKDSIDDYV